ncbi:hypothetical Protein pso3_04250 [Candidatus Phytoplasma solani]
MLCYFEIKSHFGKWLFGVKKDPQDEGLVEIICCLFFI